MEDKELQALSLKDKTIICVNCSQPFIFTVGEQLYFISKGLNEPKRCRPCLLARKLNNGGVS